MNSSSQVIPCRRPSWRTRCVIFLALLAGVAVAPAASVTVDARTVFQRMDGFGITAYADWPKLTIVAYNSATSSNPVVPFSLAGLPAISAVNPVRTSGTESWLTLTSIPASGSTFTATLPHQSITIFSATLPALKLNIARTGNNVTLTWPEGAAGFILQTTPLLSNATVWTDVATVPSVVSGEKTVTQALASEKQFFRLRRP